MNFIFKLGPQFRWFPLDAGDQEIVTTGDILTNQSSRWGHVTQTDQWELTFWHVYGDGAGLGVGGAAGVVPAVRLLHARYHQPAARLAAVLACTAHCTCSHPALSRPYPCQTRLSSSWCRSWWSCRCGTSTRTAGAPASAMWHASKLLSMSGHYEDMKARFDNVCHLSSLYNTQRRCKLVL